MDNGFMYLFRKNYSKLKIGDMENILKSLSQLKNRKNHIKRFQSLSIYTFNRCVCGEPGIGQHQNMIKMLP